MRAAARRSRRGSPAASKSIVFMRAVGHEASHDRACERALSRPARAHRKRRAALGHGHRQLALMRSQSSTTSRSGADRVDQQLGEPVEHRVDLHRRRQRLGGAQQGVGEAELGRGAALAVAQGGFGPRLSSRERTTICTAGTAAVLDPGARHLDVDGAAVEAQPAHAFEGRDATQTGLLDASDGRAWWSGWMRVEHGPAEQLVGRGGAEQLGGRRVGEDVSALGVHEDGLGAHVDEAAVAVLAVAQRPLRPRARFVMSRTMLSSTTSPAIEVVPARADLDREPRAVAAAVHRLEQHAFARRPPPSGRRSGRSSRRRASRGS